MSSISKRYLVEVPEREVAPEIRARARSALVRSAAALRLEGAKLAWFREENEAEELERLELERAGRTADRIRLEGVPLGFVLRGKAWIRADIPLDEVVVTVAHEVAHLYQRKRCPALGWKRTAPPELDGWAEEDAEAFGRWMEANW